MGIDAEFWASELNVPRVLDVPDVYQIYAPTQAHVSGLLPRDRVIYSPTLSRRQVWVITTCVRGSYRGYGQDRGPKIAHLIECLRPLCRGLMYGGDNDEPFVEVTDELVDLLRRRWETA